MNHITPRKISISHIFFFSVFFTASTAYSKPAECSKAHTDVEILICKSVRLEKLDKAMAKNYEQIISSDIGDDARISIKAEQRRWIIRRNKCKSNTCIEEAYRSRITDLCETPVIGGVHPTCIEFDADNLAK
jgi:uncharacterized protein